MIVLFLFISYLKLIKVQVKFSVYKNVNLLGNTFYYILYIHNCSKVWGL